MSKKVDQSYIDLENADAFLKKLYEVISKLSAFSKTQFPRFNKIWNIYLSQSKLKPHTPRQIKLDKEKFLNDNSYKAKTLRIAENAAVDIFYSISSIVEALYTKIFSNPDLFLKDFSKNDRKILPYLCAKDLYGKLLEFLKLEHKITPIKYLIIGKNYLLLKINGTNNSEVLNSLKKSEISISYSKLNKTMQEIESEGIIEVTRKGRVKIYTLKKDFVLSSNGQKKYNQAIHPLLEWSTQIWRSFFNIRELNINPPTQYKWVSYLNKVLSRSATQGFRPTHYVLKNLAKYYEMLIEAEKKK